ncbi:MAG TPA: hypothetical protein VEB43_08400 [Anaeromyxobacter sp.]|nr:hypothetical protein [Anaeromyxobacter sp.]
MTRARSTRPSPRGALVAALLASLAGGARADDVSAEAVPPPIALGIEAGGGPVIHLAGGEDYAAAKLRVSPFVRYGWAHLGAASELDTPTWSLSRDASWLGPGETRVTRWQYVLTSTLGASFPERTLGEGWLGRHLRLELLGETGMIYTRLEEELDAGGVGDRSLVRWTPFAGARLGLRMRFGRPWAGFFGLAAFYRHPFDDERFRRANGRREPFAGDTVGVVVFGGADVTVRR